MEISELPAVESVPTLVEEEPEEVPAVAVAIEVEEPIVLSEVEQTLLDSLTITEKLLISQAVFEFGNEDFKSVVKTLKDHSLLKQRSRNYFNADKCSKVFLAMMNELGIDGSLPYPPNAAPLLKLARKYYMMRVVELRTAMQLEQERFRVQFSEIELIREGGLDHLIDPIPASSSPSKLSLLLPDNLPPLPSTSSTTTLETILSKRGKGRGRVRGERGTTRGTRGGNNRGTVTATTRGVGKGRGRGSRGPRGGARASVGGGAVTSGRIELFNESEVEGEVEGEVAEQVEGEEIKFEEAEGEVEGEKGIERVEDEVEGGEQGTYEEAQEASEDVQMGEVEIET